MAPKRSRKATSSSEPSSPSNGVRSTKKPRLSVRGKPVTVVVGAGDNAVEFSFPEDLLIRHSDFAKAALQGNWRESADRVIRLPDEDEDDADLFEILATFIYTGKIHSFVEPAEHGSDPEWERLCECWSLGDKLQCTPFKDAILDALIEKMKLGLALATEVSLRDYDAVAGQPLKRLIVDFAVFGWDKQAFKDLGVGDSECEFLRDACIRFMDKKEGEAEPWINAGCKYHEHGTEKPCYKTMF